MHCEFAIRPVNVGRHRKKETPYGLVYTHYTDSMQPVGRNVFEYLFDQTRHIVYTAEHSSSRFDALCESIRSVKNRPFDLLAVMQFFLFIYCIVSAKKIS